MDTKWYWLAFQKFIETGEDLIYSASYDIPTQLLEEKV
jgi:hypothetical protein